MPSPAPNQLSADTAMRADHARKSPPDLRWLVAAIPFLTLVLFVVQGSVEVRCTAGEVSEVFVDGRPTRSISPGVYRSGLKLIGSHPVMVHASGRPDLQATAYVWLSQRVVVDAGGGSPAGEATSRIGTHNSAQSLASAPTASAGAYDQGSAGESAPSEALSDQAARDFATRYMIALNSAQPDQVAALYGDPVAYYGAGRVSPTFVHKDKARFYARWPIVQYRVESTDVGPVSPQGTRLLTIVSTFSVSNPRGDHRSGLSRTQLELVAGPSGPRITRESQAILRRD